MTGESQAAASRELDGAPPSKTGASTGAGTGPHGGGGGGSGGGGGGSGGGGGGSGGGGGRRRAAGMGSLSHAVASLGRGAVVGAEQLIDFNVLEAVLLASSIAVLLGGLMFASAQLTPGGAA